MGAECGCSLSRVEEHTQVYEFSRMRLFLEGGMHAQLLCGEEEELMYGEISLIF